MPRQALRLVSRPRVPVSTTDTFASKSETRVTVIGHNPGHEKRLIESLVDHYGWKLADDGNLYSSNPDLIRAWGICG